jgi:hypothetical protein
MPQKEGYLIAPSYLVPLKTYKMPTDIKRLYNHIDEDMLVKAQVFKDNLTLDLALFTAKFPWLIAANATALQASITSAEALALDTQVVANLKVLTADVNAQVILGGDALNILGIYAKLTYPSDEARQNVFGQQHWNEAKNDQEKMINALEHANSLATAAPYNAALIAKGYTALEIANLLTIANNIKAKNTLQEDAKSRRPVSTQDRIVLYNSVWQQMQTINLCSKVVFATNPAKLEQYLLYPNTADATTISIKLLINGTNTPLSNATVKLSNTSLADKLSDAGGQVIFESVNMPELIDVNIKHPSAGVADYANLSIVSGISSNEFILEVPA